MTYLKKLHLKETMIISSRHHLYSLREGTFDFIKSSAPSFSISSNFFLSFLILFIILLVCRNIREIKNKIPILVLSPADPWLKIPRVFLRTVEIMLIRELHLSTRLLNPEQHPRRVLGRRNLGADYSESDANIEHRIMDSVESGTDDIVRDATRWRFPSPGLCPRAADPCRRVIDNWCMRELTAVITALRHPTMPATRAESRASSPRLAEPTVERCTPRCVRWKLRTRFSLDAALSSLYQRPKKKKSEPIHLRLLKMDRSHRITGLTLPK